MRGTLYTNDGRYQWIWWSRECWRTGLVRSEGVVSLYQWRLWLGPLEVRRWQSFPGRRDLTLRPTRGPARERGR